MSTNGVLQATAVIAKTTQTAVGPIIGCEGAGWITFFVTYVKGDETGLDLCVSFMRTATGVAHPEIIWSVAGGVYTIAASKRRLTASANASFTIDVRGYDFIVLTQGGSNNDGTPTGTLSASYTLKEE